MIDASPPMPASTCPLCAVGEHRVLHRIADWDIRCCKDCGFAFIDPYPAPATRPDFYSESAIVERKEKKRRGPLKRLAAFARHWLRKLSGRTKGTLFLRELTRRVPEGSTVLDIGCGAGAFLSTARRHYHCTGIEISSHLAEHARALEVEVLVGDFCTYPFGERRFDAVAMVSLLEHLHDPRLALRQCHALLNPGGMLMLKTVNHGGLNRRLMGARWSGYRPPDHLVYFEPDNLAATLRELGFRDVRIHAPLFNDSFYCYAMR